ncbi:MAG TPA: sulfotransferase [Methylomirabilota bacterium]|jgi:hypothetical protein|nr:sulfotransferase [Methylomirabilota bacterium]
MPGPVEVTNRAGARPGTSERPIFIGGVPRSGTSLMRAILGSHPQVALFPTELPIWRSFLGLYRGQDLKRLDVRRRLVEDIVSHDNVARAGVTLDGEAVLGELAAEPAVTLGRVYAHILSQYARQVGRPRWGVKSPGDELHSDAIFAEFPGARVVHMMRDPRDVVVSQRGRPNMSRRHIASIAYSWRRSARLARHYTDKYAGAYVAVRYEDLVSDPSATVRRVCEVLDLEYRSGMLKMNGQPKWPGSNSSYSDVSAEGRTISRIGVGRYLTRLPAVDTWFVQSRVGAELDRWGYVPSAVALSARDRWQIARWLVEEAGWRMLSRIRLWEPAARMLGRR